MTIPVRNVYYLLLYAWDQLEEADLALVGEDGLTSLSDLFGRILASGTRRLLRRGFDRGYKTVALEVSGIRGSLDFSRTVKRCLLPLGRTACRVPEFGPDVLHNRILKATIERVYASAELNEAVRSDLRQVLERLEAVPTIRLSRGVFRRVQLHRNAGTYRLLMDVCRLVYDSTVVHEHTGEILFRDFARPHASMARLFEAFLFNFYRREQQEYRVRRESFRWPAVSGTADALSLLPGMRTDLTLQKSDRRIIIDAKYYEKVLTLRHGKPRVRTGHLYQMYAYLQNRKALDPKGRASAGVVLYAQSGEPLSASFMMQGHRLSFRSLNLEQPWEDIRQTLLNLPGEIWGVLPGVR